jgi:glycosyltransferase involved in cell wall biosynthesis
VSRVAAGSSITLCVASLGRPCGIAEYATCIARHIPDVHLNARLPLRSAAQLIHLQHESQLYDDAYLLKGLSNARRRGAVVVVTEHDVKAVGYEWEREASALVALTADGAALLRRRRPQIRVEHIPHGCPTWFPPRCRRPGRTIGAFGFMDSYKGYFRLLEAVRAIPDCNLLVFSHARGWPLEDEWRQAGAGLPVRWVKEYLREEEVVMRIASEVDVLAFHYDNVAQYSASGAVRVGLSTGVPVVVSYARWFDELGEAVFRCDCLTEGITTLLDDVILGRALAAAARDYCEAHSWQEIARRHHLLWDEVRSG